MLCSKEAPVHTFVSELYEHVTDIRERIESHSTHETVCRHVFNKRMKASLRTASLLIFVSTLEEGGTKEGLTLAKKTSNRPFSSTARLQIDLTASSSVTSPVTGVI